MKLSLFDSLKRSHPSGMLILRGDTLIRYQGILRRMLSDVDEVCKKEKIRYSLGGGSALGAVRHKGMIPWDDDIDVNMLREDLERFLAAFEKQFENRYWIHRPETTHNYPKLFVQIRLKGTVLRELEDLIDDEAGIPLDVFPVENTYDNVILRCWHGMLCMGMKFLLSCRKTYEEKDNLLRLVANDKAGRQGVAVKGWIGKWISFLSLDKWTQLTINCCKLCKRPGKYVTIPSGRKQFFGEISERKRYENTCLVPFDGQEFQLIEDSAEYLKQIYGPNYLSIPSEEQREHHAVLEIKF